SIEGTSTAYAATISNARGEFVRGWRILLGSTIGVGTGVIALPVITLPVFLQPLQATFDWSRSAVSASLLVLYLVLCLVSPVIGWLADRMSEVYLATLSLAALAVGFLLLSHMNGDIRLYYAVFAAFAVFGAGSSTLVYARIVNANFNKARGTALGIAL